MNQRQAVKTIEGLREDVALSAAGDAIHINIPRVAGIVVVVRSSVLLLLR